MKRFISILLVVLVLATLISCGSKAAAPASSAAAPEKAPEAAPEKTSSFPTSTVTIIVPFAAGGGTDLIARILAEDLSKTWGVSVIVENITGGSGAIGMMELANAKPDGHTVVLVSAGAATLVPVLNQVGYTNKEFAPFAQVTEMITCLATHSNSGLDTFEKFMAEAAKNPGQFTYGTTGAGSQQFLLTNKLQQEAGTPNILTHIPFDGGAQAIAALVGEQTTACVAMVPDMKANIESGVFTPLFVYADKRLEALPDVPTITELGYPDLAQPAWYGFAAPAGTPDEILDFWDNAIAEALAKPEIIESLAKINQTPIYLNRETFHKLWMDTYEFNKTLVE